MMILRLLDTTVKPHSPHGPRTCQRCSGNGRVANIDGDLDTCPFCEGHGRVTLVPPDEPAPPVPVYFATVGADELDQGKSLTSFVRQIQNEWPESASDIVVWKAPDLSACESERVVALLRPMPGGGLSVQWM